MSINIKKDMLPTAPIEIATVVILDDAGRLIFQLRDDIAGINHPGHWGLFGGRVETGETPLAAIVRELCEELRLRVDQRDLIYEGPFAETPAKTVHLFSYAAGDRVDAARLTEGQGLGRFAQETLRNLAGDQIEGRPLIPIVGVMVRHFLGKTGREG